VQAIRPAGSLSAECQPRMFIDVNSECIAVLVPSIPIVSDITYTVFKKGLHI
jgi:hypothetical protein